MQAVSQGQTHKAEVYLQNLTSMQLESRASDPVQSIRYYNIVLNTLLRKAAEYGAVHPIHIDALSSRFARKIEAAVSQNGSELCEPLGVVDLNRFVTSLCTSLSSLRYTKGL